MQNISPASNICAVHAAELCPHSLLPRKAFCLFSNTSVTRGWEAEVRICSPWRPFAHMCVSGKSCLLIALPQSGCQIPGSLYHLFFQSSALQCRHMFEGLVCAEASAFFPREEAEEDAHPCPLLQVTPNQTEILNDSKVSAPSKKFHGTGLSPETHPEKNSGDSVPSVFAETQSGRCTAWISFHSYPGNIQQNFF